jgi:HK97 family phage major capsid protein/HK97 family phage prohead protease
MAETKDTRYLYGSDLTFKQQGDVWLIEGYASTNDPDDYNEIVDPESFRRFLPRFLEWPLMLLNHRWFEIPVGHIAVADIRADGLWVEGVVSKAASGVWQLIQEKNLRAFSIGFQGLRLEEPDADSPNEPAIWREIELMEVSIVNRPANRNALFAIADSKGINLNQFTKSTTIPTTTKREGAGMPITEEALNQKVTEEVGAGIKTLTPVLEAAATKAAEAAVKTAMAEFATQNQSHEKQFVDILEALKGCATKAETEEMRAKVKDDLSSVLAQNDRLNRRGLKVHTPHYDIKAKIPESNIEKAWTEELNLSLPQIRVFANTPAELFYKEDDRFGLMLSLHEKADCLYLEHIFMSKLQGANYGGVRTLKSWGPYLRIHNEFRKAMDTATSGEGTEWIPTAFSASMTELIEIKSNIAPLFRSFSQPTKVFEWPLQSSRATAYLIGESTSDAATAITASTSGTSKTTFTAKKLANRMLTSTELIEDSIIAILPFIREDLAKALANGVDSAIINGDTAGTHMDADVTDAKDVKKAWLGIRAYNKDNSKETDESGASNTLAALRADRKTMGVYGVDPDKLAFLLSISEYFDLLDDTGVTTIDTFGPMATILKGKLAAVDGVTVKTTQHLAENLNASGVNDGVTETYTVNLVVNTDAWMIGDRRIVQVDMEKIIETDQYQIVATLRKDFEAMHGTDSVSWTGYKVTP